MRINDSTIKFSKKDRETLGKFFMENDEFISNNSFIEYENIKKFGDIYG